MKPDASYLELQRRLRRLIVGEADLLLRQNIKHALESRFASAWHFLPDRRQLSRKLYDSLNVPGLDHCEFYTTEIDQRVIVTQPYGDFEAELIRTLTLSLEMQPEITTANEWAFYYPGKASLVIMKFPSNYVKAWSDFQTAVQRKAWEKDREECIAIHD
jgi:hypothetical protein